MVPRKLVYATPLKFDKLIQAYMMTIPYSGGATSMHRAELVDILVRHLPSFCKIRTSKRLLTYTESPEGNKGRDSITLHFADGTTEKADVLIGADGVKSATRMAMYNIRHAKDCPPGIAREQCEKCKPSTPHWTGTVAYRNLIPTEQLIKIRPDHRALCEILSVSDLL